MPAHRARIRRALDYAAEQGSAYMDVPVAAVLSLLGELDDALDQIDALQEALDREIAEQPACATVGAS